MQNVTEKGNNRNQIKMYYHARGCLELKTGQCELARTDINKALEHSSAEFNELLGRDMQALFYSDLSRVFLNSGVREKAIRILEKIPRLTTGRFFYGDVYALSFYRLGVLYQMRGWEGKAIDCFRRFLKIWKSADSHQRELKDAGLRLSRLGG